MQKPAISLAYDGSHPSHLSVAAPLLAKAGLRATFFLDPARLLTNLAGWREVAAAGHELANGSLLGSALPDGSIPAFHLDTLLEDLRACDDLLGELFGGATYPVALPLGVDACADGPYAHVVVEKYPVVRTGRFGVNSLLLGAGPGLLSVPCRGATADGVIEAVRGVVKRPAWLVVSVPELGPQGLSREAHKQLIGYLEESAELVEVEPIRQMAERKRKPLPSRVHLS